jgi:FlaA1/EpsC-like NDP-sugar epimerase
MKYLPISLIMLQLKSLQVLSCLKILENNTLAMNKLIVVTGGTKGIGRKLFLKNLLQHDFDLATCSRNEKELTGLEKGVS